MKNFIKNRFSELLKQKENKGFKFIPDRMFYEKTGIKQKRWGLLIRNESPATTEELLKVAQYFDFDISEILEKPQEQRQLV